MRARGSSVSGIDLGPGKGNSTGDFLLKGANLDRKRSIDVLIFTDSRGACLDDGGIGWAPSLFRFLETAGFSTLLAVRPRDCTVFLTLMNFLRLNGVRCDHLVAQVGLVDFTPKKADIIDDIFRQGEDSFRTTAFETERLSSYRLLSGRRERLYSIRFDTPWFRAAVADSLGRHCRRTTLIGTMEVTPYFRTERKRPPEFFPKLKESNRFLAGVAKVGRLIDYVRSPDVFMDGPNSYSSDGVHYTARGHMLTYISVLDAVLPTLVPVSRKRENT